MTLTSDRATKGLYEKYISMIKRVTTKTMGGFSPAHPLNHQQTGLKQHKVVVGCQKWWNILQIWNKKWWFKRMLANLFRTSLFHRYWWKQMADIEATLGPARKDDGKTSAQHINHSPRSAQWFSAHSMPAFGNNFEDQKQSCVLVFPATTTWAMSMLFLPNLYSLHLPCVPISIHVLLDFPHSTSAVYLHILVEKLLYTSTWQNVLFSTWLQQVNLFYS